MRRFLSLTPALFLAVGCGGNLFGDIAGQGGSGSLSSGPIGMNQARLSVTITNSADAKGKPGPQMEDLTEAKVTIREVTAHSASAGWVTVTDRPVVVNLLRLADHAVSLGFNDLPPGKITQIRLLVTEGAESYVTTNTGERHPMKVPSGPRPQKAHLGSPHGHWPVRVPPRHPRRQAGERCAGV
jgi:hypothetical protein